MIRIRTCLPTLALLGLPLGAQDMSAFLPKSASAESLLEPGEALVVGSRGDALRSSGEARRPVPIGGLAGLLWVQAFGDEWGYQKLQFPCRGTWNGFVCRNAKGHGKVDLGKALEGDCDLAILAWASESVMRSKAEYGDGPTRSRLEEVFQPFMGDRMKPGAPLPAFGSAWAGAGNLLQASPEEVVRWMLDPAQERVKVKLPNLLIPLLKREPGPQWWIKAAASDGVDGQGGTWVVGSDGLAVAALYRPQAQSRKEALARFKALVGAR